MALEMQEKDTSGKEKNWISITIIHGGERHSFEHNIHTKVRKVIDDAIKAFGIQPPPNTTYYLTYGNVNLDDPNRSLKDYGIPDGAELALVPRVVRAG